MKIPGFEDASATIKFIRIFNCLFDILNSRSLLQNKWKQPLNVHNFKVVKEFLMEAQAYIKTLTVCQGQRVVDSNRKTGFIGFLVCISSVLHLYTKLGPQSSAPLLKFLPIYKCSQDHLEMFCSAIRSRGGWNNNPTARQFISAYKKLLIDNEIRESDRGNCIALEEIPILTYSGQTIEQQINFTTERRQLLDMETHLVSHDHDYVEAEMILSEVATHIVVYISGFVVRHLERTLQCETCMSVLRGEGSHTAYSLIHRKSRGGLISPSDDVVDICMCSEKVFRKYSAGNRRVPVKDLNTKCVSEVLGTFLYKPVFEELGEHMKDQHPLDNHLVLLIKAIAKRYLLTRQKHAAKCVTDSLHEKKLRTAYTKLVLFKGQ
ncbi:uncharacterized protein LOC126184099 [Schistocerca cancellata]|uniref:uncharacterized protein LOC126184099 n=1 Tax=Schistocerca cancellata TaxID=274614 RepID=UPI002118EA2D|nr:uncharacterized protein LOC126184099 [Schistocerca cancellata]